MAGERMYPVLPCADLDEALTFYGALGFETTFIQHRPYPCAVVARGEMQIHLSGIEGFEAADSYASVIVTVPDPGALHVSFRDGLRERYGRTPLKGIPRLLPVRRKAGTATGFSVVDAGGNWLRFYASQPDEAESDARRGLARVVDVAARQGDSRGDEARAIAVLDAGLLRYPDAPATERFEAIAYRAELKLRLDADASSDIETAARLAADHALGEDASRRLDELRQSAEPLPEDR